MRKRDVTDWTQKDKAQVLHASGPSRTDQIKNTIGNFGLLMCAVAIVAVLAKAVKDGGLEEYDEKDEDEQK